MHREKSRHASLVRAWWLAVCYLLACSVAQAGTVNVDVGPFGSAHFVDRNTTMTTSAVNPAITVIHVGDTVQWTFFYTHSSTSGTCDPNPPNACTADGIWDSTIQNPSSGNSTTFQRTFNSVGVFPYFCLVHLATMRGVVIVLSGPDYDLFRDPTFFLIPPPTATIFAGGTATFSGNLDSYFNFITPVNLSCANGNPRNPTGCPTTPVTVTPTSSPFSASKPFSFSVSENAGGDYTFDIAGSVAVAPSPFSHRKQVVLHVNDLALTAPSPASLTVLQGTNAQVSLSAQALGLFAGTVSMSCNSVPLGIGCNFNQSSFLISPGPPQGLTSTTNTTSVALGNYTVNVIASSMNNLNTPATPFTRSKSFNLRIIRLHLSVGAPATAVPGSFNVTVSVRDQDGTLITGYVGTVTFSSSGANAGLPGNYTFLLADAGSKTFSVTANEVGPLNITISDVSDPSVRGSTGIIRVNGASPNNAVSVTSSRALAGKDAYFQNTDVTLTATVTSGSGTPTGIVRFFDGTTDIGTAPLSGSAGTATASLPVSDLPVGDRLITAVYEPDIGTFTSTVSPITRQLRFPSPHCKGDVCPGAH